jgi:hypothetical protein
VNRNFLTVLLAFAVALPLGLALGRRDSGEEPVENPVPTASPARPGRVKQGPLDLQELLRDYEAEQQAWIDGEVDPIADFLADWTEDELKTALTEALTLPRCLTGMGNDSRLPWELIGAWVKKNPDAVAVWIEGVRSAEIKDELVREALRHWPRDRAMEGIEFLLAHHWKPGQTYWAKIIRGALEDKARQGSGEMIGLLDRLAAAKIGIGTESLDLPADFDYSALVGSDGFRAQDKAILQDVVFSKWQDSQPREMLDWMEQTGDWERFNNFLDLQAPATVAASFWDEAEPELRENMLGAIKWREFTLEEVGKFIAATTDPEGQDLMIVKGIANGTLDPVEMLELIPSAERRLNILLYLHPHTDWHPDAEPTFRDPPSAPALRTAIRRWDIPVPPPVVEPDPFADP